MLNATPIDGPQAWLGAKLQAASQLWTHDLSAADADDLIAAVRLANSSGKELIEISAHDFPLTCFYPTLMGLRQELLHGRGFCLIRGLPTQDMSRRDVATCFWGIGAHLGLAVSQNGKGHVLGHVKNLGLDYDAPTSRGYQTNARLPYHTDYADLVGLLCLNPARNGGASSVVSSVSVYNEMLRRRPDLVEIMRQPLYRTRWGEVSSDRPAWIEAPTFNVHANGVATTYVRSAVRKAQLMPAVPRLSAVQEEAMDLFDQIAQDPSLRLDMHFEVGDFQFVNNHSILHSRTAYEDHQDPDKRRHLLRLWLACEDGPVFPPAMTKSFQGLTQNGRLNGIYIPGTPLVAPLEAC